MVHNGLTDRELLEVIFDRSERVEKALYGNGQPGALSRLAAMETLVEDINKRAPSRKEKLAAWSTIVCALIAGVASILARG